MPCVNVDFCYRPDCGDAQTPRVFGGCGRARVVALTAVVLIAVVSTVIPAVTLQSLVNAQVVVALEPSGTSCPTTHRTPGRR